MRHLSGPIFSPSTLQHGVVQLIASLQASHVKTFPWPGDGPGWTANDLASSSTSSTMPTLAVRDTSFWRTSQASLLPPPPLWTKPKASSLSARPPESWENWPTAGGMRNGSLFQRPTWVPAMDVCDGSAGHGDGNWTTPTALERSGQGERNRALILDVKNWPTPQVGTGDNSHGQISGDFRNRMEELLKSPMWLTPNVPNGGRSVSEALVQSKGMTPEGEKKTVGLESQTRYWATPKTITGGANSQRELRGAGGPDLQEQVLAWPTPRGTDGTKGGPNQAGSKGDLMLPSAAVQWPTPAARDSKGTNSVDHMNRTDGRTDGRTEQESCRSTTQLHHDELFAPGPADPRWAGIIARSPHLAPALEPTFRSEVNGLAFDMDDSRAARLKCVGNGVVPLAAAAAVVVLLRRAGFVNSINELRKSA
jgi:hypothetical protein